jgi:hypothetical protein
MMHGGRGMFFAVSDQSMIISPAYVQCSFCSWRAAFLFLGMLL